MDEITRAGRLIQALPGVAKLNLGALGNQVPQLHVHVVGRHPDDPAWPEPVWGHSAAVPYAARRPGASPTCGKVRLTISGNGEVMQITAPGDPNAVVAALKNAAAATGSDFSYLLGTAMRESSLKPNAQSNTSSAGGLFQFLDQTWLGLVKTHGAKYGLGSLASDQRDAGRPLSRRQ